VISGIRNDTKIFLDRNGINYASESVNSILSKLYDLIDEKGFAPPDFLDYNDFGREAQKSYDDIYHNAKETK